MAALLVDVVARHMNTSCRCKVANHVHGTRVCYVIDKCRCALCRMAAVNAERLRREHAAQARWGYREGSYVDASAAVAHIRTLQAAGLGGKSVTERAGLDYSLIYPLLYGRSDRNGGALRTKCRPATRDAILAVPVPAVEDLMPGAKVDATPTRNRVQALGRMGYSVGEIARKAGIDRQAIDKANRDGYATTVATHNAIRAVFDALWSVPCNPSDWRAKIAATRTRRRALELGWPSPLDLDDDGHLIPAEPVTDSEDAPKRGGRTAADLDEWKHLVLAGVNPERAAQRCGVTLSAIEKQAYRTDRPDVLNLLLKEAAA